MKPKKNPQIGKICTICGEVTLYGNEPYEEMQHASLSQCFAAIKSKIGDLRELVEELQGDIRYLGKSLDRVRDRQ